MADIVTHPRFARAKVEQPCPRRRKGTIDLRKARWRREYYSALNPAQDWRPEHWKRQSKPPREQFSDMVSLKVDGSIKAGRLIRALKTEGLALVEDAIVDDRHQEVRS